MEPDIKHICEDILGRIGVEHSPVEEKNLAGQLIYAVQVPQNALPQGAMHDFAHALDYLVKKIVEHQAEGKEGTAPRFLIDINDLKIRQIKDLQAKALMMADRARSFQYDVELAPMTAYERLIVHATLSEAPNIKTESQGEGRMRRVVIKYQA